MFLATTALTEFWDTRQEILLLGSWCVPEDRTVSLERLQYRMMPSPWENRERFYQAARYLDEYGERLLDYLTDYLNGVHGVSHTKRYWRILVGPWLLHHLHATYDRYVHLRTAFEQYPNLEAIVLDPACFYVPRDTLEAYQLFSDDPYNLQMFSQFLSDLGHDFPAKSLESGWADVYARKARSICETALKRIGKRALNVLESGVGAVRGAKSSVRLHAIGIPKSLTWVLAVRSGLRIIPYDIPRAWGFEIAGPANDERRNGLKALPAPSQFERLFAHSLSLNFPTLYLESYLAARRDVLYRYRIPPVLVSAEGWFCDEPFKFLAAEASQKGTLLVRTQHGGGYGVFRFSAPEVHDARAVDHFMAWGWADPNMGPYRNLASPALSTSFLEMERRNGKNHSTPHILYVGTAYLRYLLRFDSCPIGIYGDRYLQWQVRFVDALPERLRRSLLVRSYPGEYGRATREKIAGRFREVRLENHRPFCQALASARVAVIDYSGTAMLEALVSGIPTILFWDAQHSELRDEAIPYFESLRKVGILRETPEEAAVQIIAVYDNPWVWWSDPKVQDVRAAFIDRFALSRQDWLASWVRDLGVLKEGSCTPVEG